MRADHRFVEARAAGLARLAHAHVADERQPLDLRHERAQVIGEVLGQHRQHPIGEIDRRRARTRLAIERGAEAHVMAHIGDRHDQPPAAAADALGVDRIVEVPRVRAVDGDQRQLAQILAALVLGGQNVRLEHVRLMQHLHRKLLRQVVPQDREARRKVRGLHIGEYLDHAAVRGLIAVRPLGDVDDDVVAVLCAVREVTGDLDRIPVARILRLDAPVVHDRVPDAADPLGRIGRAAKQARHAPPAIVQAGGQHLDAIVVHERADIRARQGERRGAVVRDHEHIAVRAAAHAPRDPHRRPGGGEALRTLDRLTVAHHRGQPLGERVAFGVGAHTQALRDARRGQRLGRLGEVLEQELAARDGLRIALRLEREIRVLGAPVGCDGCGRAFSEHALGRRARDGRRCAGRGRCGGGRLRLSLRRVRVLGAASFHATHVCRVATSAARLCERLASQ